MAQRFSKKAQSTSRANKPGEFRKTPMGYVPSAVGLYGELAIDQSMKAALTHANAKLVIEIDTGGTRVILADRNGQAIGGIDDLEKLGGIRAFVARERKDAGREDASKETSKISFLATQMLQEIEPAFEMKPVGPEYAGRIRPLQVALGVITKNREMIARNVAGNMRSTYEPILDRFFVGMLNAYTDQIAAINFGADEKGFLKRKLFEYGVPEWFHSKCSSNNFKLEKTENLEKVLFPADPMKGLALTLKEWRDVGFIGKMGPLLGCSQAIYHIVNDDEVILALAGAKTWSEVEASPSLQEKILQARVQVVPFAQSADRVIELGEKKKGAFSFPSANMDSIQGAMTCLSVAVLRVFTASLQSVDLTESYYSVIAPSAVSRDEVQPGVNFYSLWKKAVNPSAVWIEAIKGGRSNMGLRKKFWTWISTEMKLVEGSRVFQNMAQSILLDEDGDIPEDGDMQPDMIVSAASGYRLDDPPTIPITESEILIDKSVHLLRTLSATEVPVLEEYRNYVFPTPVEKKTRKGNATSLSVLTPEAKNLLRRVNAISPYVSDRMSQWLRSFSDDRLQIAAVKVSNAEFDEIFTTNVEEEDDQSIDWTETDA